MKVLESVQDTGAVTYVDKDDLLRLIDICAG